MSMADAKPIVDAAAREAPLDPRHSFIVQDAGGGGGLLYKEECPCLPMHKVAKLES